MTDHDLDLYAPFTEDAEPERVCSTCKHLEPCPCGCGWGVCTGLHIEAGMITINDSCIDWEEE